MDYKRNDLFVNHIYPFIQRVKTNNNIKKAIAKKALEYINDNNSIFIDGGITNFMLIKEINHSNLKNLTIISDHIISQLELSKNIDIEVIATGGHIIKNDYSCYGNNTPQKILDEINTDIAFITTRGITINGKLTTPSFYEGKIKQIFIKKALKKILITDSTKFGITGLYNFANISDFNILITDKNIPKNFLKMLNNYNLKIEIIENI